MNVFEFCSNFSFNALFEQIDFISKCQKSGRKQFIVVPDRFSLTMEKLVMERLNLVSTFNICVVTFSKLAGLVIKNDKSKKVLNMLDGVIITEHILKKNKDSLKCFGKIPASTGFAKVLFDSFSQLKSCKITPGMLRYELNKQTNENLKLKISDIAFVYDEYEKFISSKFLDSNNKLGLLCEKMKTSQIFDGCDVHFCNFLDFTQLQYDVLKEAIKCSNNFSISTILPEKEQNNKDFYVCDVALKIDEICEELNAKVTKIVSKHKLNSLQTHMLNNLSSLEQQKKEFEKPLVELYSLDNREDEILFVIKKMISLIKNGASFKDMVIVCSDITDYKNIIEKMLTRYNIPFWVDQNQKLEETEYYKFIKDIFDVIIYGYQMDDVLKVCQNVFSNLSEEQKENFFVYAKKFGIVGSMWKEDFKLENTNEKIEKFFEDKRLFLSTITSFENSLKNCKTIFDFCSCTKELIKQTNMEEKAECMSVMLENKEMLKAASVFRQTASKIESILDELCAVLGEEECTIFEWLDMFLTSVKTSEISPIPMGINSVLVGQMLSTIFEPNKFYFVVGAVSQKLPAFVSDVGIISDSDISCLSNLKISPTIEAINKKTIFTVLQNLCLWQEKLFVSFPRNGKNTQNEPSKVIFDIENMLKINGLKPKLVNAEKMLDDNNIFSQQEQQKFLLKSKFDVLDFVAKHAKSLKETDKNTIKQTFDWKEMEFILSDFSVPEKISNAHDLFFANDATKATEVEKYFSCPFLHFVDYGLKLKENEVSKIMPVDVGNILHDICEKFAKFCKGQIFEDEKIEFVAEKFFDEVMQKKEFEHFKLSPQNRALSLGLKEEAIRICKALNYQNKHSKYKITFAEKSFGENRFVPMPEICVYNSKRKLKLRGKVDRVDFYDKKFRVIDYKTGKAKSEFKMLDLYMGKKMQLYIYLYALYHGLEGKIPTGAYYFPLHNDYLDGVPTNPYQSYCMNGVTLKDYQNIFEQDDLIDFDNNKSGIVGFTLSNNKELRASGKHEMKKNANLVSQNSFYSMIAYSQKLMSRALAEILSGYVCPKPTSDSCTYCRVKTFCPYRFLKVKHRKDNFDVEQENFFEEVTKNA